MNSNKQVSGILLLIVLFFIAPRFCDAQMFSVDRGREHARISTVGVYAGVEPINFEYKGEPNAGGVGDLYSFKGTLLRFSFETPGVNLSLGTGGKLTGLGDASYFDAGIKAAFGLFLYHSEHANLIVPLQLKSTYTRVANDEAVFTNISTPEFQQGTLQFGTGLTFNALLKPRLRLKLKAVPSYGFSFATQSSNAGGSIFSAEGKARLYFEQLFGSAGLSIGYNYKFRKYNIDDELLDYNATTNSFLIGVIF